MTDEAANLAVAMACGTANRWLIMKHGFYYRPDAHGYTRDMDEAWVVSEDEADKHVYPHDDPVTKHRAPIPDYGEDLNACHEMEKALTPGEELLYFERLGSLIMSQAYEDDPRYWKSHLSSSDSTYRATARQRRESFLRVKKLWQK